MSVSLNPSTSLGFHRPLTELIKRTLTITNHNAQPVAFKVKTTAPKLYCVRPNAGRIEPGESVDVSVQLQPMKEEPPPHIKCKDKFLVQSTIITPNKEDKSFTEIWNTTADSDGEAKVHQHKLKVTYLPPEGQTLEEEPEEPATQPSQQTLASDDSRQYETVRQQPSALNGHAPPIPTFPVPAFESSIRRTPPPDRSGSPAAEDSYVVAREEQSRLEERHETRGSPSPEPRQPSPRPIVNVNVHTPPAVQRAASPSPDHLSTAAADTSGNTDRDLTAKLSEAQAEIQRLRALLAATPDPAELRRRVKPVSEEETIAQSDGDALSDIGTTYAEHSVASRQEGASPQQVGIIALMVFIITYLFF